VKSKNASAQSVLDFRAAVSRSFSTQGSVLLNVIDALAVGPRPASPVEVTESALFAYHHHSLYQGLRRGASALGEKITSDDWLLKLRSERLSWLRAHPPPPGEDELGAAKLPSVGLWLNASKLESMLAATIHSSTSVCA